MSSLGQKQNHWIKKLKVVTTKSLKRLFLLAIIYRTLRIKLMLPREQWTEDTTYTGITSDFHLTSNFLDEEQVSPHTKRQRGKMGGKKITGARNASSNIYDLQSWAF